MKGWTLGIAVVVALSLVAPCFAAKSLLIDDFNDGAKPNNIGGDFGAWNKDPNDVTQSCINYFDYNVKNGESGCSVRLEYDVDSPNPAYNGFWMKLQNIDIGEYNKLILYVKGDPKAGYTPQIKIELKNNQGEVGRYFLTGISDEWKKVEIPIEDFRGLASRNGMTEFVIVFDDINSYPKVGTVYIDDISFEE